MDFSLVSVDYLGAVLFHGSVEQSNAKFTNRINRDPPKQAKRRTKNPESCQERMGLESNVCVGGILWTRSNSGWQGEYSNCQLSIKLTYHVETLILLLECLCV